MKMRNLVLPLVALGLAGCGGAKQKINHAEVQKVRSIAVVGYLSQNEMERDMAAGGTLGTINALNKTGDALGGQAQARINEQGEKVYEIVRERVGTATGWKVLTREELAANPAYQSHYSTAMSQPGVQQGWQRDADGVLWDLHAKKLTAEQRDQLMTELGVDGLAIATVTFVTGKKTGVAVGGVGNRAFHPKAVVSLKFYGKGSAEPILVARSAGKPTSEGLKTTLGVESVANETELFLEASGSALDTFATNYQESNQH